MATARPHVRRVGVIGDVHGEDRRLEHALGLFAAEGVDRVLAVGDLVDGVGDVSRALDLLERAEVDAVRGNHDRWFLAGTERGLAHATRSLPERAVAYLAKLPPSRRYTTPRGGLMLGHGVGEDDMSFLTPETQGYLLQEIGALTELMLDPEVQYFVGGHTHRRMVRAFAGVVVVNAGTIYREDDSVVALVDFERAEVAFYSVDDDTPPRFRESQVLPAPLPVLASDDA